MNPSISHCPECGYCLTGLPARHRCPECGFEYDEFTRVWKPREPRHVYGMLLLTLGISWLQAFVGAADFVGNHFTGWADGFCFVIFWPLTGLIVWQIYRLSAANRRGRFVAICPAGLAIRTLGETQIVPWSRIRTASAEDGGEPSVILSVADDALQQRVNAIFARKSVGSDVHQVISIVDRAEFVNAVNTAIKRRARELASSCSES